MVSLRGNPFLDEVPVQSFSDPPDHKSSGRGWETPSTIEMVPSGRQHLRHRFQRRRLVMNTQKGVSTQNHIEAHIPLPLGRLPIPQSSPEGPVMITGRSISSRFNACACSPEADFSSGRQCPDAPLGRFSYRLPCEQAGSPVEIQHDMMPFDACRRPVSGPGPLPAVVPPG